MLTLFRYLTGRQTNRQRTIDKTYDICIVYNINVKMLSNKVGVIVLADRLRVVWKISTAINTFNKM